jgi:hypothetical protein
MPADPDDELDAGIVGTESLVKGLTKPADVSDSTYQQRQDEQVRLLELALRSTGAKR